MTFVETAVGDEITRPRTHSEFTRLAKAAIDRTVAAGDGLPVATVIARLEAKLVEAKKVLPV